MVGVLTWLDLLPGESHCIAKKCVGTGDDSWSGVAILYFSILLPSASSSACQIPACSDGSHHCRYVVMSVRYDSKTIAIFATIGGVMTPRCSAPARQSEWAL